MTRGTAAREDETSRASGKKETNRLFFCFGLVVPCFDKPILVQLVHSHDFLQSVTTAKPEKIRRAVEKVGPVLEQVKSELGIGGVG